MMPNSLAFLPDMDYRFEADDGLCIEKCVTVPLSRYR